MKLHHRVIRAGALGVVVAASAAVLSACSMTSDKPVGPTEREVAAYTDRMLDATWVGTGLEGIVDRPRVTAEQPVDRAEWATAFHSCMSAGNFGEAGTHYAPDSGYFLSEEDGRPIKNNREQLVFYTCVARNPVDPVASGELLTAAQLGYTWDYYQRWTIPCLSSKGLRVTGVPSRFSFQELGAANAWTPFDSLRTPAGPEQFDTLIEECGPLRPEW